MSAINRTQSFVINFFEQVDAVSCGEGWTSFEDSKCFKFYDSFEERDAAVQICSENSARLLSIKSRQEQDFLKTWIFQDMVVQNSIWLDGNRSSSTNFVWADGDAMSFTNWDVGYPTNQTGDNGCMEMSPNATVVEVGASEDGKWKDVPCSKSNLIVCEKKPTLTAPELQNMVVQLRDNPVPLGFIYVQLPLHPSPQTLWPNLHWRNVSSSYAGLFFRAEGGTASAFGVIQSESSNRLGNLESSSSSIGDSTSITVPSKGWSEFVRTGYGLYPYVKYQGIRVQNTGNETFPRNMAMRIWERI
ncbi:Macrophage mannose receptor 1 [Folsomia candida]|uniref:Macrophage mannose receptor 1 n=1 Tax=Folsomia candida TaxID=158441 RepID=A0A226DAW6_FOLCA|nr:Macrophage mannose receptor 1 [Folsomia candida]